MPRGNKKGPMGDGPSTGRGMGYCTGHQAPGYAADAPRRGGAGSGRGRGAGRGMGRGMGPGMGRGMGRGMGLQVGHHGHQQDHLHDHLHDHLQEHHELSALRRRIQELESRLDRESDES